MKLFFKKVLIFFLPIMTGIAVINVAVDPANIYRAGYEAKAAELLLSGENVAGMGDHDERIFQEEIIQRETVCPDTILLGSSRVMTLSAEVVGETETYMNHGVSGAGVYDHLGILGIYASRGWLPPKVIFGLDPWILNEDNGDTRYQSMMGYIRSFEKILGVPGIQEEERTASLMEKKMQLLSIPYFQKSAEMVIRYPERVFGTDKDFHGTKENIVDENIRYTDGSIEYPLAEREKDVEQAEASARDYVKGQIYQIEGFDRLSGVYCDLLEKVVGYLQDEGVEVIIYLPPYHPYVYQYLGERTSYKNVFEAEIFFVDMAKEKGIDIFGSYDPGKTGCSKADFLDGMHVRRSSMGKAWKKR